MKHRTRKAREFKIDIGRRNKMRLKDNASKLKTNKETETHN